MSSDDSTLNYIHGYDLTEQQRLIAQAHYWQHLICKDLDLKPGESLLEIGCGVGAVMGLLAQAFAGLTWAGIDLQPQQIAYAHHYLATLGLNNVDLRVGDAQQLPWESQSFDHLFAMWFLEHVVNPQQILQEGFRVLKPGGTVTLIETDYSSCATWPVNDNFNYLIQGLCDLFLHSQGNPFMGRRLGSLLNTVGFTHVENTACTTHHFQTSASHSPSTQAFFAFIDYVEAWLAPTVPQIHQQLGRDLHRLAAGLKFFRELPHHSEGAITITVYRARARKTP